MTREEYLEYIKTVPQEHPFVRAEICKSYYFEDTATYITRPAYDAYTLPIYDSVDREFSWTHIDMDDDNRQECEFSYLSDLIDSYCGGLMEEKDFKEVIRFYKIPPQVIDEEIKYWQEWQSEDD